MATPEETRAAALEAEKKRQAELKSKQERESAEALKKQEADRAALEKDSTKAADHTKKVEAEKAAAEEEERHKADAEVKLRQAIADKEAADQKQSDEERRARVEAQKAEHDKAMSTLNNPPPGSIAAPTATQEPLINATTKASNPASHAAQMKQPVDIDGAINKAVAAEQEKTNEAVKAARAEGAQETYLSPNPDAYDPHTDAHSNALQAQQDQRNDQSSAPPSNAERNVAYDKLTNIIAAYPDTAPNSHIIFGYGGVQVTLGDLRAVFG